MNAQQQLLYRQQQMIGSGTITGTTTDALTYNTQGTHVIHWSFSDAFETHQQPHKM